MVDGALVALDTPSALKNAVRPRRHPRRLGQEPERGDPRRLRASGRSRRRALRRAGPRPLRGGSRRPGGASRALLERGAGWIASRRSTPPSRTSSSPWSRRERGGALMPFLTRVLALAAKEVRHVIRDPRSLYLALGHAGGDDSALRLRGELRPRQPAGRVRRPRRVGDEPDLSPALHRQPRPRGRRAHRRTGCGARARLGGREGRGGDRRGLRASAEAWRRREAAAAPRRLRQQHRDPDPRARPKRPHR